MCVCVCVCVYTHIATTVVSCFFIGVVLESSLKMVIFFLDRYFGLKSSCN